MLSQLLGQVIFITATQSSQSEGVLINHSADALSQLLGQVIFTTATQSSQSEGVLIDYSADALSQHRYVEVDQQANLNVSEAEISEQLGFMDR
jgi:hypothetical protein